MAAKKYNLHKQASSGIILENVRKIFKNNYIEYANFWIPKKFKNGKLYIHTENSAASSALFMKTHEIIEQINKIDLPQKIREIIIRKSLPR